MRMALELAARAQGRTHPNPMVGAVVVRGGRVVGRGYHPKAGQPHAEIYALREAGGRARGATLYVSLEPCAHVGRTPPCAEAIVRAGVRRVVAAMIDPDPRVSGRGLRRLRAQKIRTTVGVLAPAARQLNRVFITWKRTGRPFVTVKVAQSLDGKIATHTGSSRWISSPAARRWVHQLREEVDGILIGVETMLQDNPRLSARLQSHAFQPMKVVLDSHLRTPPGSRIFSRGARVLIATTPTASPSRARRLQKAGAGILRLPTEKGRVKFTALLRALARREISHLLIEGGGEVIASALAARAVDRYIGIMAPKLVGGRTAPTPVEGAGISHMNQAVLLQNIKIFPLGPDLAISGEPVFRRGKR